MGLRTPHTLNYQLVNSKFLMEDWEKDIIVKNMDRLVKTTICNITLLAALQASGSLGDDDVDVLLGLAKNQRSQVFQLYTILQKRVNAFEALLEGLQQTNQTGAVTIITTSLGQNIKAIDTLSISYDGNTVLGNGSNGTVVYKGKFGGRDVAVKKVHLFLFGGAQAIHEVKILQDVDAHENIVRYFGAKQTKEFVLIALELCEMSLNKWVENNAIKSGTLDKKMELSCTEVLRQITVGLEWLHSKKIVHRDIKPENVLLLLQMERAKLADFGLSRKVIDGNSFVATANVCGTAGWIAPEILACVVQGKSTECKFTFASDVFSLGCIFYYVLTDGKYAFGDSVRCQTNILDGKPQIMESKMKLSCAKTFLLVKLMISKDPKSRPTCPTLLTCSLWSLKNSTVKDLDNNPQSSVVQNEAPIMPATNDTVVHSKVIGGNVIHLKKITELSNTLRNAVETRTPCYAPKCEQASVSSLVRRFNQGDFPESGCYKTGIPRVPILSPTSAGKDEVKNRTSRGKYGTPSTQQLKVNKFVDDFKTMDLKWKNKKLIELVRFEDLCIIQGVLEQVGVGSHANFTEICLECERTMLHVAAAHQAYDVVEYLLNAQGFTSLLSKPLFANDIIHECLWNIHEMDTVAFENKCKILEVLFSKLPQLVECGEKVMWTPLHQVLSVRFSNGKQLEFIQFLLKHNANVNTQTKLGNTPLHLTVQEPVPTNAVEIVSLFITHGADTDVVNKRGFKFWHKEFNQFPPGLYHKMLNILVSIQRIKQQDAKKILATSNTKNADSKMIKRISI